MPNKLVLSRAQKQAIAEHCQACFPAEACGLLLGQQTAEGLMRVQDVIPSPNVAPNPARHFEVDPLVHLKAQREARQGGTVVLGHYHSHPDHPAAPSATDRASIIDPALVWLIVRVTDKGCEDFQAFRVIDGPDFQGLALTVEG